MAELAVVLVLEFLHIAFGILWIGGIVFGVLVLRPAMARAAPAARKEVMRHLLPIAMRYTPATAGMTILFGVSLYVVLGEFDPVNLWGRAWGRTLLGALITTLATFAFGMTYVFGAGRRIQVHLEEAECAHGPEVGALQKRFNRGQMAILVLGLAIVAQMVVASRAL